jgi:predicted MPP superfamily phosphohydrolase
MIFFWLIPLSLLSVAAYFSAKLIASAFSLSKKWRLVLVMVFLLCCVGFFVTYSISHSANSSLIRVFYIFFASFIGLLFYLTASSFLLEIIKLFKLKIKVNTLAILLMGAALLLFALGLFSAFLPRVKNISVSLDNLPTYWQGKKIVQLSDVHLGNIYQVDFLEKIVAMTNGQKPDLIVITGDLFDGPGSDLSKFTPILSKLSAPDGVFFISGNHDSYLGDEKVAAILDKAGIKILDNQAVMIEGLEVIGLSYGSVLDNNLIIKNLQSYQGQVRVLLKHIPDNIDFSKELKTNLQLSGHTHKGQMFPIFVITNLIYDHYHYGLHTEGAFNIYTSSGVGSWGPPVRTFNSSEIISITLN